MVNRRTFVSGVAAGSAAVVGGAVLRSSSSAANAEIGARFMSAATPVATAGSPTVVLVHGAFADSSSWNAVIPSLFADGINVVAAANPLRGLASDAAYVASVVKAIAGPVLLVGHSYGGAVITNVVASTPNAVGLVYIAAYAPDEGQTLQDTVAAFPPTPIVAAIRPVTANTENPDLIIDPAAFHEVFAADLPEEITDVMAVSQRPLSAISFGEKTTSPGWKTLPSWALVALADNAIGTDAERAMAQNAGSTIVEVDASHGVAVSQPSAVSDLIKTALASLA